MKIKRLKNTNGGALLFTIVTAFVISFTGAALTAVMLNHSIIVESEIKRMETYYLLRAGFEYAYSQMYHGVSPEEITDLPDYPNVQIQITPDQSGVSDFAISVTMAES